LKCYLNSPNFYSIIGLTGIYIECYLCGEAEFKAAINRITVDFGSSSQFTTTTILATPTPTTRNGPATSPPFM